MEQSAIISWTPANWITVVLMVVVGFLAVGTIARIIQQRKANQAVA